MAAEQKTGGFFPALVPTPDLPATPSLGQATAPAVPDPALAPAPAAPQGPGSFFPPAASDRLTDAIGRAPSTGADQAAKIFDLQLKTGLPADLIARNLDEISKQAAAQGFDAATFRQKSPALAAWLEQHPLNASVSQGDLVPLSAVEKTLDFAATAVRRTAGGLYKGMDLGTWSLLEAAGDVLKLPQLTAWAKERNQIGGYIADTIKGPTVYDPAQAASPNMEAVYQGFESIGSAAPVLAGAIMSGGSTAELAAGERLSLSLMGTQTGGAGYTQARDAGVSVPRSLAFGVLQGGFEAATEKLPLETLLGDLAHKSGLVKTLLHQAMTEVPGEQLATALQDFDEWAYLHPDQPFQSYLDARPAAAMQTLIATLVTVGVQTGAIHTINRITGGMSAGQSVNDLAAHTAGSATAQRSPEKFAEFVKQAAEGQDLTFHAPLDTFAEYWQSQGVDPATKADELTGVVGSYEIAFKTGEDLVIPADRLALELARDPAHQEFFAQELRLGPDEMNQREATAFQERIQAEGLKTTTPPATPIRDQVVKSLTAAGIEPATADSYASLYEAAFQTLGERAGVDPTKLFEQYGLRVARPDLTETAPAPVAGQAPERAGILPLAAQAAPGDASTEAPGTSTPNGPAQPVTATPAPAGGNAQAGADVPAGVSSVTPGAEGATLPASGTEAPGTGTGAAPDVRGVNVPGRGQEHVAPGAGGPLAPVSRTPSVTGRGVEQVPSTWRPRFVSLLADAKLNGYTGTDDSLAGIFLDALTAAKQAAIDLTESEEDVPTAHTLLQAIANAGGIGIEEEAGPGHYYSKNKGGKLIGAGMVDELETMLEGLTNQGVNTAGRDRKRQMPIQFRQYGKLPGGSPKEYVIRRKGGMSLDSMRETIAEDPRWSYFENLTDFVAAVDDAIRQETGSMKAPGVAKFQVEDVLANAFDVQEGSLWWAEPETVDPAQLANNASGESAASLEAMSRQASMKTLGQQFVVYDRAGNRRVLIGPEAVDYQPYAGETYGIQTATGFRLLEDNGGKAPAPEIVNFLAGDEELTAAERAGESVFLGDSSFDLTEFNQGLFDLDEIAADPETGVDILATGEAQARLPGDVGAVRDREIATPQLAEVPFSLTAPVVKEGRTKAAERPPSEAYLAAKAAADTASAHLREVAVQYRAREVGDTEYLDAREASDRAAEAFDRAYAAEQAQGRGTRTLFQSGPLDDTALQAWAAELMAHTGPDLVVFGLRLDRGGNIEIENFAMRKGATRAGLGSAVMQSLTRFADQHGKRIVLQLAEHGYQPDQQAQPTSTKAALKKFYQRFGFVENKGRHKNFALSIYTSMYREPTAKAGRKGLDLRGSNERVQAGAVSRDTLTGEGDQDAIALEAQMHPAGFDAEVFANLFVGEPLSPEADRLLSAPSLATVVSQVRRAALEDPEIFRSIVRAVPVDVVNRLFGSQLAAEEALRNEPMLQDRPTVDAELPVADAVDAASPVGLLLSEVARQATEVGVTRPFDPARKTPEGLPADATNQRDSFRQDRRASIRFGANRQFTITLLERADLSSFLHESAHFYLEVFRDIIKGVDTIPEADRTDSQRRLIADMATIRATLVDADHTGPGFSEQQHEQFAKLFETYLMEGQAPSIELRGIFQNFAAWLKGIYRSLLALNVDLTPEVRSVFDRMLATDAAIFEVEQQGHFEPMFTTAESAGMTSKDFELYRDTVRDASRAAREKLQTKLMGEVQRAQTEEWQRRREEIRVQVQANVYERPVYKALAAMQKGTNPDGTPMLEGLEPTPMKLSKAALVQEFGPERLKRLPKPYLYTNDGGMNPTIVADLFGFSSVDEMLTTIENAGTAKSIIEHETDRRMLAENGSILLDGTLHEAAQAATANDDRETVVRAEIRALNRLRRTVKPFVQAGQQDLAVEQAERAYERRWHEAEAELRIAIVKGEQEAKIDALRKTVNDLKRKARSGPAIIRGALPPVAYIKFLAEQRVAATKVRDLQPQRFYSASRRTAQLALEASARQDFDGAIAYAQQELLNLAIFRAASDAKDDVATRIKAAAQFTKTSVRGKLGLAGDIYLDQVDNILERYSFKTVSMRALNERRSIRQFVEQLEAAGEPVDLPAEVLDDTRRMPYQELTIAEFKGVTDGLRQIAHLAKLKNTLLTRQKTQDFNDFRDALVLSIRDKTPARKKPLEFRPSDETWRTVEDWYASHAKLSTLTLKLDGGEDGGPMWEAFTRQLNAASDDEVARNTVAGTAYHALLAKHYTNAERARFGEKTFIPAIGDSLSKEARLEVLKNWGNKTSRDRLTSDPVRKWSQAQVEAIIDTLDERDTRYVQDHWDYLDTYWPEIAAKSKRLTGLEPEKVEPLPVKTKYGELRGGYHPLAYDSRLDVRASATEDAAEAKMMLAGAYLSSTTNRGHEKARVSHLSRPIRLEMSTTFGHLAQVIHDLTHHEVLIDANRLLRDGQLAKAIQDTQGDIVYQKLKRIVEDIALGDRARGGKPSIADKGANFLRSRAQIAGLAYNLLTGAQQPLGLFNGMERVGMKWVALGTKKWLRDAVSMQNTAHWIADVSPMMAERLGGRGLTQDLHDVRNSLSRSGGWFDQLVRTVSADHVTQQGILDSYLWHIGLMQSVADVPTWLGAYEKEMAGDPSDEPRAIALADQAVLDSQGGAHIKDLAEVQRGGPLAKMWMTFASYSLTVLNSTARAAIQTDFRSPAEVLRFAGRLSLLYVMPTLLTEIMRCGVGRAKCESGPAFLERVGGQVLSTAMNGVLYVRELQAAANIALGLDAGPRGYEGTASTRFFQTLTQLSIQVHQGKWDAGAEKAAFAASGLIFNYPAAQVQRSIDGFVAFSEGKTHNPLAVLFGPPAKGAK